MKVITTCNTTDHDGYRYLEKTLVKHGFEFEVLIQAFRFGSQYTILRDWANNYKGEETHFVYVDAWDNVAFGSPDEVMEKFKALDCKMLISAEKNCFPNYWDAERYDDVGIWKYVNGGGCMFEINYFRELMNKFPIHEITYDIKDPIWLMEMLFRNDEVKLDYNCEIFQTLAFSNPNEWQKEGDRFRNIGTNTLPVFFHHNGIKDMKEVQWVYEAIL